jgi:hypothetical protein
MPRHPCEPHPYPDSPLVVAYGLGVDSTAMLIEFVRRGIRPDHILLPTPAPRSRKPTPICPLFNGTWPRSASRE